jgi:hypothetical protein
MSVRTAWIFRPAAAPLHSTASARSDFVIMVAAVLLNTVGYVTGLSSPAVTESSRKRKSLPKSQDGGYTRPPPFSMNANSRLSRSQPLSALRIIAALASFHLLAVLRSTWWDTAKQQGGKTLSQFGGDSLRTISKGRMFEDLAHRLFSFNLVRTSTRRRVGQGRDQSARIGMSRRVKYAFGRAALYDLPLVENADPMA